MVLEDKIKKFKRKYYADAAIKGSIFAIGITLTIFLIINTIEYIAMLPPLLRGGLFFSFLISILIAFYYWIFLPIYKLFIIQKQISDEEAAIKIGQHFPLIQDKLLNTLQLYRQDTTKTDLIAASIGQNVHHLEQIDFSAAINLKDNQKYLRYLFIPLLLIVMIMLFFPQLFTESTPRIIRYQEEFSPKAPFEFSLINQSTETFQNDDYTVELKIIGQTIPASVYLTTTDGRKLRMSSQENGAFAYTFKKIQRSLNFRFFASGFYSSQYELIVRSRPSLHNFNIVLDYPAYIGKNDESIKNTGNLIVPEGTKILWQFKTEQTDSVQLHFVEDKKSFTLAASKENLFEFEKKASKTTNYTLSLKNQHALNKENIEYYLNVIADEYPNISLTQYEDTLLYQYLVVGGQISDDYGISELKFRYRINEENSQSNNYQEFKLAINEKAINQSFFHKLDLASFGLKQGQTLEYYLEVWDNDGVNGRKKTKSSAFEFKIPTQKEFKEDIAKESQITQNQIEKALQKSKELGKELKDIQDRIKSKKRLDWQDKKEIEKLLEKKEALEKEIEKLQKLNEMLNMKQEKFSEQNEKISEKAQQLQELMNEVLDEETKKLYNELQELLEQNNLNKNVQDKIEKLDSKQKNVEKELERALELFKRLKLDNKIKDIQNDLEELSKEQDDLAKETEESKKSDLEQLSNEQKELNQKFEQIKKELQDLQKLNDELKSPKSLDQIQENQQKIDEQQKNAQQQLEEKNKKKASESQKDAAKKMRDMAKQMQQMMQSAEMQEMTENYEDLRKILENLLKLSFDQESLMKDFRSVKRIDPKFVKLSQQQLKLKDDAKLVEDSLFALSKRVFQIQSFVTREVGEMNKYMNESLDAIKRRFPEIAVSKQQFTMTSINNLALLLDDILEQMQQQMSQSMGGNQMNEKKGNMPSMSELQKQLNQKIENLKKSGKSGRQLSKELAELAAEQEMLRNAIKQSMNGNNGKPNKDGNQGQGNNGQEKNGKEGKDGKGLYEKIMEQMEKTEIDLINKKITDETIKRQQEILTRLLESEKSQKERDEDKQRKAETAKEQKYAPPVDKLSDYLKTKEMQIELLKTIPTSLKQYYKKEVDEYFKKIKK